MSKIAHRTILDLFSLGMAKELEDMGCNADVGCDCRPILDQVFASLPFHLLLFLQTIALIEISHKTWFPIELPNLSLIC
jgi:hypothetical protein